MIDSNSLLDDQLVEKSNGVYRFDPSVIRLGQIAGIVGILFLGIVGALARREEGFSSRSSIICLLISFGLIFFLRHVARLSGRTLQIDADGVSVRDKLGNEIGSLPWVELGKVTERRKMAQLALWDKVGVRRVLVDQQFENFTLIRSRIIGEYAKVFTLKSLPIEFHSPDFLSFESSLFTIGAGLLGWASWRNFEQGQGELSIIFLFLVILALLPLLRLYPRIWGPSVLFEDRIVLRSAFHTETLYKRNIVSVEIRDLANYRSGTKYSLITLKAVGGKQLKITRQYGNIPEIFVTLRTWMAQR